MGISLNPFTGLLDLKGSSTDYMKAPVANAAALPLVDNSDGDARVTLDTDKVWVWDATGSRWAEDSISASGTIGATPNAQGYTINLDETVADLRTRELVLQPADSSNPGILTVGAQNISGNKTFDNNVIVTGDFTVNGTTTTMNTATVDIEDPNVTYNKGGDDASSEGAGVTIERTGTAGSLIYEDALASKFKLGALGSEIEIADIASIQSFTNKTIDDITNNIHADVVHVEVRNISGSTITKGTPVYVSGYNVGQDTVEVLPAEADVAASMPSIGLAEADILNNSNGEAVASGVLENIDTSSYSVGDVLYIDTTPGGLTNTKPTGSGELIQAIAKVLRSHASLGVVLIQGAGRTNALPNDIILDDSLTTFQDNLDNTKQMQFQLAGITAGNNRILTIPDASTIVVGTDVTQILTSKSIDADNNIITNIKNADIKVGAAIDAAKIADGTVSSTEFQYINSLTSNAQDQMDTDVTNLNNHESITYINTPEFDHLTISTEETVLMAPTGSTDAYAASFQAGSSFDVGSLSVDLYVYSTGGQISGNFVLEIWDPTSQTKTAVPSGGAVATTANIDAATLTELGVNSPIGVTSTFNLTAPFSVTSGVWYDIVLRDIDMIETGIGNAWVALTRATTGEHVATSYDFFSSTNGASWSQFGTRSLKFSINSQVIEAEHTAAEISYDNADSNLAALITKDALDELDSRQLSGDINQTAFSLADNQAAPANITGLSFANGVTRSAIVHYAIVVDATADLYEVGTLDLVQRGADWSLAERSSGDNALVTFSVTAAGQVQYTTPTYAGYVSAEIKFRAKTTEI